MKILSNAFLEKLDKPEINILTKEVKETLDVHFKNKKIFTAADLWNIQRQKRDLTAGRF